jgi:hypothetical protein
MLIATNAEFPTFAQFLVDHTNVQTINALIDSSIASPSNLSADTRVKPDVQMDSAEETLAKTLSTQLALCTSHCFVVLVDASVTCSNALEVVTAHPTSHSCALT